jgi:hypothetical protein
VSERLPRQRRADDLRIGRQTRFELMDDYWREALASENETA